MGSCVAVLAASINQLITKLIVTSINLCAKMPADGKVTHLCPEISERRQIRQQHSRYSLSSSKLLQSYKHMRVVYIGGVQVT